MGASITGVGSTGSRSGNVPGRAGRKLDEEDRAWGQLLAVAGGEGKYGEAGRAADKVGQAEGAAGRLGARDGRGGRLDATEG